MSRISNAEREKNKWPDGQLSKAIKVSKTKDLSVGGGGLAFYLCHQSLSQALGLQKRENPTQSLRYT